MATSKKALAMAAELAEVLARRIPSLAVTTSFDTDGSPLIKVGAGTNGAAGGLVKVQPIDWSLAKDILGNASAVYTPHVVKVGVEANYAGTSDGVADINTWAVQLPLIGAAIETGCRVEVYQSTNGTAPTAATLADSTKLVAAFDHSSQYPMVSSQ